MIRTFKVVDITWDCDDENKDDLPSECYVDINDDFENDIEYENAISEYLSNNYGYCVLSFYFDKIN